MNRVQRRLWTAFLTAGGEVTEQSQIERFQRLIHEHVDLMPPALSRVMTMVLSSDGEVDYDRLAAELAEKERLHLSQSALRQRVSRAIRRLEAVIRETPWRTPPRTAIVFEGFPYLRFGPEQPPSSAAAPTATRRPDDPPTKDKTR